MALAHWQRTFTDTAGNIQAGIEVTIRNESTGALAAIFTDSAGTTPKDNPFTTDPFGYGDFYAADGRYRIIATGIDWRNEEVLTFENLQAAVDDAETFAQAAALNAGVYDDTTAGLAATSDGDYFSTPSPAGDEYLILYRNDAGVATEIDTYPNRQAITDIRTDLASTLNGQGASLVSMEGGPTVEEAVNKRTIYVGSVTELQSVTSISDGQIIYLAGRTTAGDGGEGEFRWYGSDLSSTLVLASVTSTSVDDTTDTITSAGHGLVDGDGVTIDASVNGLTANALYWVVGATTDTFQLSTSFDGAAVDLVGTTNFTTNKLLDPLQGVYVVSDRTGAGGAWVRAYRKEVMAKWFGVQDGSDATEGLQAFFNFLSTGEIGSTGTGSYSVSKTIKVLAKDGLRIDAHGSIFTPTFGAYTNLFEVNGLKSTKIETTLSADALRGDLSISVSDATGIEKGNIVRLFSQENFDPGETKKTYETNRVRGVSGTTVFLDAPLLCDFTSAGDTSGGGDGTIDVEIWNVAEGFEWHGGKIDRAGVTERALSMEYLSDPIISDLTLEGEGRYGVFIFVCVGDKIIKCRSYEHGVGVALSGNYGSGTFGYGFIHTHCAFSQVIKCHGGRGWHCFDASDGVRDVSYYGCKALSDTYGFSTHQNCISAYYYNCSSEGKHGHIHRARYVTIDGGTLVPTSLSAVSWTQANWQMNILRANIYGSLYTSSSQTFLGDDGGAAQTNRQRVVIDSCNIIGISNADVLLTSTDSQIIFSNNYLYIDSSSTNLEIRAAEAIIKGNEFVNSNGPIINQNASALSTDITYIEGNLFTGQKLTTETAVMYCQAGEFHFVRNTHDIDAFRLFRVFTDNCSFPEITHNAVNKGDRIVQLSGGATATTVDFSGFNAFLKAGADPYGSGGITVTTQFQDYTAP